MATLGYQSVEDMFNDLTDYHQAKTLKQETSVKTPKACPTPNTLPTPGFSVNPSPSLFSFVPPSPANPIFPTTSTPSPYQATSNQGPLNSPPRGETLDETI
ncbi:hypothetical protein QJS04_geneDACA024731 [Acorus gramineus]|uniref:Uncharacterized protein n=1 Tax=Acorus gramineus TaxID=55184 RepID=A0AAV9BLA7_ACOGR|nr:hypothetical protein QJS04_geneDACA024731 [Acorus gramineus]